MKPQCKNEIEHQIMNKILKHIWDREALEPQCMILNFIKIKLIIWDREALEPQCMILNFIN